MQKAACFRMKIKNTTRILLIILLGCVVILSGIWIFFQKSMEQIDLEDTKTNRIYRKHYVLIADEADSAIWQSVYESASAAAAEADAYLELIWPDDIGEYTLEDSLRISIASMADGIILRPDGSGDVRTLINQASEAGIPVVTILDDDTESGRISFVGLNSYQMGDAYAQQALSYLRDGHTEIMLLADSRGTDAGTNLIYTQIYKSIEEQKKPGQTVNITAYPVDSSVDFETEEVIRDIFVNGETTPDILICLDEVATECAYQALVDHNEVGNTDIIGFHYSELILDAVKKGTIPATIALDTEEIGRYSVSALEDYLSLGHASEFYSVGMNVITAKNAELFGNDGDGTQK